MSIGEINKGAIILILVLLFGAGGYLWYSQMYKPAVAERVTAKAAEQAAQTTLDQAKSELAAAQQRIEQSKDELAKPDDSVSRVQLARKAVPNGRLIDDAAIVLMDIADRSGIRTSFKAEGNGDAASTGVEAGAGGATPIDLEFEAVGTYAEMMLFMRNVEGTVEAKDGKLYARDRLFNVVKLEIGSEDEESGGGGTDEFGGFSGDVASAETGDELVPGKNEELFKVTVRMYSSSTETAQGVGEATPDAAAAGAIDPATGQPADPNAAAGGGAGAADPNAAAGAAPTDPNAAGAAGAAGGIPATDPAAAGAPAGGS